MKKTILAVACAASFIPAHATEVELYGVMDAFVAVNNTGGRWASGISSGGINGSHWGIKGKEDLGGGTQVFFNLEEAFEMDTGKGTYSYEDRAFSREATIGIRSPYFGHISVGRQYTPYFLMFAFYDPTDVSLGAAATSFFFAGPGSVSGAAADLIRNDNSIMYILPLPFGLTNFFFVSLGESGQNNRYGNVYNYAARYTQGNFSAMVGYLFRNVYPISALKKFSYNDQYLSFAASYDFGVTKPAIIVLKKFTNNPNRVTPTTPVTSDNLFVTQIGTATPLWGGKWMISGTYLRNQTVSRANAWGFGTKYSYPLSKKTRVYAGVQLLWNGKNAGYAIEAGPDSSLHFHFDEGTLLTGYGTDYLGKNVQQFFVGINHHF